MEKYAAPPVSGTAPPTDAAARTPRHLPGGAAPDSTADGPGPTGTGPDGIRPTGTGPDGTGPTGTGPTGAGPEGAGPVAGAHRARGAARTGWRGRFERPPTDHVTVTELVALGAAVLVAVIATMSLATAHLGVHGPGTVLGSSAVLAAGLAVLARLRSAAVPRVALDAAGLLPAAAGGVLALFMFLPGFHYATSDKDPGGYVMHAFAIARGGSTWIHDPLLAAGDLPVGLASPGARFPGIWVSDAAAGTIFPQFYHLWPALQATSLDLGGYGALVMTTPLLGVLGVVLSVAVARRIAGPVAGWATAVIMATNMMEVWQAKYPTTEVLCQVLFVAALLGVLIAVQTGWRWPAGVGGLLLGVGYLGRPDGVLLVLFAVGVLALLWVLRRWDARATWFAVGLAVVLPYAYWQAYGPAHLYTESNGVPSLAVMLGLVVVCLVGALVLRPLLGGVVRRIDGLAGREDARRRAGLAVVAVVAFLFALARVRGRLFGADLVPYGPTRTIRSYDEMNLERLSWFFTWPGMVLIVVGVAVVALRRRWSPSAWLVTVMTVGLLALYVWHARNSPYFMWVGRRFVPSVLPGMVLLIALALAALWAVRFRGLRVGVVAAVALLALIGGTGLSQSLPLRSHDEWAGSYGVNESLSALSGDERGIYLWAPATSCCGAAVTLFGGTIWLQQDEESAILPGDPAQVGPDVAQYVRTFPDQPVFLVYETRSVVPELAGLTRTPVGRFAGTMPHWRESSETRPDEAIRIPYDFTVYRVGTTG